ncbi:MAG: 23S rRNA (adenine(2503)-C(2))-methyltransferase RlmN [Acidobacteriota bacterium]
MSGRLGPPAAQVNASPAATAAGTDEPSRPNLLGLPRERLAKILSPVVDRPFRVDQIYRALHERRVETFDEMTDLSKALRGELATRFRLDRPDVAQRHLSADGTEKILFRLHDGATIEAVDIPDGERRTLCVSSQAGCALACRFCVTGFWGAGRNLGADEIVAQVDWVVRKAAAARDPQEDARGLNLVFMGMGEPLLNLENVRDALEILMGQISWRRITLSTAGVIPGIEDLAGWPRRPRLAISLHAPDEARRDELMPINKRWPLRELMPVLKRFPLTPKERITFEYILIDGFNDAPADADLLARLLRGVRAKVNLIPLNPDPVLGPDMRRSSTQAVAAFRDRLRSLGVLTTVRKQRGDDVSAACGQLRAPSRDPRGFRRSNFRV